MCYAIYKIGVKALKVLNHNGLLKHSDTGCPDTELPHIVEVKISRSDPIYTYTKTNRLYVRRVQGLLKNITFVL